MTNLILLSFSALIFTIYVALIWHKYGVLDSISASFYRLPVKRQWIFTFALWGFSIPIIIYGALNAFPLLFIAGISISWTGIASAYNSSNFDLKVHVETAMIGTIMALLHVCFVEHLYYLTAFAIIAGLLIRWKSKKYVWWIEIIAYYTILIGLLWKS